MRGMVGDLEKVLEDVTLMRGELDKILWRDEHHHFQMNFGSTFIMIMLV
jgi:hypothetical protein